MMSAKEPAIPKAARLYFASSSRAMKAIRKGCSKAIISHVSARGPQNRKTLRYVSWSLIFTVVKKEAQRYINIRDARCEPRSAKFEKRNECFELAEA
jgi:hypothetical protein